ncbi:MAG: CopD family protein [Actinobacteria bacterium]|nr:CopD family protein [Actinomycetota bacterium]
MTIEDALRNVAFSLLRLTTFASNGLLFGLPIFVLAVLRPSVSSAGSRAPGAGRRVEDLVRAALTGAVAAVLVTLLLQTALVAGLQASELGGRALSSVLSSGFGTWSLLRIPLLLGMGILLVGRVDTAVDEGAPALWWGSWLSLAGAVLVATSLAGHARVSAPPASVINDSLHLASGSTWFAGVVALVVILPIAAMGRGRKLVVAAAVTRFSKIAFASIALAAVTGTLNSYLDVRRIRDLWATNYGVTLSLKIAFFLAIVGLGAMNHFVIRRRLEREVVADDAHGEGAGALFRKTVGLEVAIAIVLLGVTAVLTGLAPTKV